MNPVNPLYRMIDIIFVNNSEELQPGSMETDIYTWHIWYIST